MGTRERSFATLANVSLEELVSADHFYWIRREGPVFAFTEEGARRVHRFQMLFSLTFIDDVWTQCQKEPWPRQIVLS